MFATGFPYCADRSIVEIILLIFHQLNPRAETTKIAFLVHYKVDFLVRFVIVYAVGFLVRCVDNSAVVFPIRYAVCFQIDRAGGFWDCQFD